MATGIRRPTSGHPTDWGERPAKSDRRARSRCCRARPHLGLEARHQALLERRAALLVERQRALVRSFPIV
jgi:hypothetical protein